MTSTATSPTKVAAIVVTYNRAADLCNCVTALCGQTRTPEAIYVVDNHSTDSTREIMMSNGWLSPDTAPERSEAGLLYRTRVIAAPGRAITVCYLFKDVNDGGAGGFYAGMKLAYDEGYDRLWMMDDDGRPDDSSLEQLLFMSEKYDIDYANPMVLRTDDPSRMPWPLPAGAEVSAYEGMEIYEGHVNPFNGTFIHRRIPASIGFIKKEMFIWGDEVEYTSRVREAGFKIATVCTSRHYHPNKPGSFDRIFPFGHWTVQTAVPERRRLLFRNLGYLYGRYYTTRKKIKTRLSYTLYFLVRLDFRGLVTFHQALRAGIRNRF